MSFPELDDVIRDETAVAHLATSSEGRPHVAPVWYRYEDGVVSLLTGGKKLENIRENPRVALSIQEDEDGIRQWLAVVRGTATVSEDDESVHEGVRYVYPKYLGDDAGSWPPYFQSHLDPDPPVALVEVDVGSATVR